MWFVIFELGNSEYLNEVVCAHLLTNVIKIAGPQAFKIIDVLSW